MNSRFEIKNVMWTVCLSISVFLLAGSVWISRTYGTLSFAIVNESFRNGLSNKRTLFVKGVVLPTLVVFIASVVINKILKKSVRRAVTYIMGGAVITTVCVAFWILDVDSYLSRQYRLKQPQWYDIDNKVIHALGSIDDVHYTNSKEALENSYQNGNKLFECDMVMTADGKLAACHDWEFWNRKVNVEEKTDRAAEEVYIPTLDVFMSYKLLDKYTPLSGADIVMFLREHPDAYIITDTKYVEPDEVRSEFQELVDVARENDCEETLDRFVVQLYHGYMLGIIEEIYSFPNYIFTLYQEGYRGDGEEMKEYAEFCMLYNIDVITMSEQYYSDELLDICNKYDIRLFVHTVNEQDEIETFLEKGVGVYTDNIER